MIHQYRYDIIIECIRRYVRAEDQHVRAAMTRPQPSVNTRQGWFAGEPAAAFSGKTFASWRNRPGGEALRHSPSSNSRPLASRFGLG